MEKHRNPPETAIVAKPKPDASMVKRTDSARATPGSAAKTPGRSGNDVARSNKPAVRPPAEKPTSKDAAKTPGRSNNDVAKSDKAATKPPAEKPVVKRPAVKPPVKEPETAPLAKARTPQMPGSSRSTDSSGGIGRQFSVITPRVLQDRSTILVKAITVNTREVVLHIYDDGAIDHDTVSVYLDKKQIIYRAMLTDRPLEVTIHLDESQDYHELVMVAENEGEIPPNTSLMIVKAGDKEFQVRITSTEQKNAMVTFKYQK